MNNTKIEWSDRTWNPVTGCTKVSQGCKNCYAEIMHERFNGKGSFSNVTLHEDKMFLPNKWKKPCKIFVNSMSDLFHESVPFEFIASVMGTIYENKRHTFQILTKRPERMLEFFKWYCNSDLAGNFPNMWLGVSVEDNNAALERIPLLQQIPAAVRFLSCEPLLERIRFSYLDLTNGDEKEINLLDKIDWVIVGGESGPKARPMHPRWARLVMFDCGVADIPFFFKQWGQWMPLWENEIETKAELQRYTEANNKVPRTVSMMMLNGKHNNQLFTQELNSTNAVFPMGRFPKKQPNAHLLFGGLHQNFPNVKTSV